MNRRNALKTASQRLQAHVDACQQCRPSVLTADNPCFTGVCLLGAYWNELKRGQQEWWDAHPEEWTYGSQP